MRTPLALRLSATNLALPIGHLWGDIWIVIVRGTVDVVEQAAHKDHQATQLILVEAADPPRQFPIQWHTIP